jgi:signal transduction histidine kinase
VLAHELRNPLGTLSMNLEIMRLNPGLPEHLVKCRDAMARQTEQMSNLIDDLTDVSRISQGKLKLDKVPLEVNQLVAQAVEMCGSALEAKQHTLTLHQHSDDIWVAGDPTRLKQTLCNVVHNACRYTPEHGQIDISIARDEASVSIAIADNGIGIPHDMIRPIFDMFVQAGPDHHVTGGLGIGLTLVRRLVEKHGGTVSATSEGVGKGSTFVVSLPLMDS